MQIFQNHIFSAYLFQSWGNQRNILYVYGYTCVYLRPEKYQLKGKNFILIKKIVLNFTFEIFMGTGVVFIVICDRCTLYGTRHVYVPMCNTVLHLAKQWMLLK